MPERPAFRPSVGHESDASGTKRGWMRWECSLIGSADGVSLQLRSALVEPLHCAIMRVGEGYELWDLNTRSGTFLNDIKIIRAPLAEGDRIRVGPYKMRFVGEKGATGVAGASVKAPPARSAGGSSRTLPMLQRVEAPATRKTVPFAGAAPAQTPKPANQNPRPPARVPDGAMRHPDGSGLVNSLDPLPPVMKTDVFDTADLLFASLGQPDVQAEIIALRRQVEEQRRLLNRLIGGTPETAPAEENPAKGFRDIERQLKVLGGEEPTGMQKVLPPNAKPPEPGKS